MHDSDGRDHLDRLIDDAARSMMSGGPSASFLYGIRSRIERTNQRTPHLLTWRVGLAAAVLTVGVMAGRGLLDLTNRPDDGPAGVDPRVATAMPTVVPPARLPVARDPAPSANGAHPSNVSRPAPATPLSPEAFVVIEPIPVEPLMELSPIELELMETPMPLRAEWLEIEPLSIQ